MFNKMILGDCLKVLPEIPNNTFDAIITDPPYLYLDHKLDADLDFPLGKFAGFFR